MPATVYPVIRPEIERSPGRRILPILQALILAGFAAPLRAQQPPASRAKSVPTQLQALDKSMTALLDEGWVITSGATMFLTLHKADKWTACGVDDGRMMGTAPTSRCFALK
jgi:hypothetical protein